ncbi:MAG: hypothetical protein LC722_09330 [Actinobacteria bacterium]|nr:hypothetical protein [Actinomycetota bacterium]
MTQEYGDAPQGEPDPANATAEDLRKRGAGDQARHILEESEERTEENATVDPDDHSVIRRRAEETADPVDDDE